MTIQSTRRITIVLFLAVLSISRAAAQGYLNDTGSPTYGLNIPVENGSIDVSNGNLHLEIPLSMLPQRGKLQLNERLVYDSRIWTLVPEDLGPQFQPTNVPNSMAGWRLTTGMEAGTVTYATDLDCDGGSNAYSKFQWTDPQGTPHLFSGSTTDPSSDCPAVPSLTSMAIDGSGYSLIVTNGTSATIFDSQGDQVYPNPMDTNGNYYSKDANGNLVDTLGRTPVITTIETGGNKIFYDVLTIGGARARYAVTTEQFVACSAFNQVGVAEPGLVSMTAISSIELPDGTSYSFQYDTNYSQTSCENAPYYGELVSMRLPTGALVTFSYSNYEDSYQNINRWLTGYSGSSSIAFAQKVLTNCSSKGTGCKEQVTVSRAGNDTVDTLTLNNGAWNTQTDVYQGKSDGSGSKILSLTTGYNFAGPVITKSTRTTTLVDTGQMSQSSYTYNSNGQATAFKEWDYFTGSPSTVPTRETDYIYSYPVNGQLLVTQSTLLDSTGTPVAQSIYNYDENTSLPSSNAPQHAAVSGNRGNVTSIIRGLSSAGGTLTTKSTYDDAGAVLTTQDPLLRTAHYAYDATDTFLTGVTGPTTGNGIAHSISAAYDSSTGLSTSSTDENGLVTVYSYDPSTLQVLSIAYPDGGSTTYRRSATQAIQTVAQTANASVVTTTNLDGYGRPVSVVKSDSAGDVTTTTSYNSAGNVQCVSNPARSTPSTTDGSTCFTYDALGRVLVQTQPDATLITKSYSGNVVIAIDENTNSKKYVYDAFHRLIATWEPDATGTLSWETDYTYNAIDRMIQADQKGGTSDSTKWRTRKFAYNSLGQMTSKSTPEAGTETDTYDGAGNLKTANVGSKTITYAYDELNRLTGKSYSDGSASSTFTYDVSTWGSAYPKGRRVQASRGSGAAEYYSYDPMGRIVSQSNPRASNTNPSAYSIAAAYDLAGNLTSLAYPDGRVIAQSFDTSNRLTSVNYIQFGGQSVGIPYLSSVSYGPTGLLTSAIFGNGIQVAGAYNSRQSLTSMQYLQNCSPVWKKQYGWGANAQNLSTVVDAITPSNSKGYTYDPTNRLTSVSTSGSTIEAYSYDPWGNLQQSGIYSFIQSAGTNNQVIGYRYDPASGKMTQDGLGNVYTYTVDGMMASSNGATYTYDADAERVRKDDASGGTEYVYFGGNLLAEQNVSSGSWTDFIYGTSGVIAEVAGSQNATPTYRLADYLGSPQLATDSSGNLLGSVEYLPYGQIASGGLSDPLGFTGLEWDSDSSSYHAWYRQYSPAQGRWLVPDPYDGSYDPTDPQTLNRYAYVRGNPLGYTDPSGLDVGGATTCLTGNIALCLAGIFLDAFEEDFFNLIFGSGPEFHGSMKPRPGHIEDFPNGESLGIPAGMSLPSSNPLSALTHDVLGIPNMSDVLNPAMDASPSNSIDPTTLPICWQVAASTAYNDLNPFSMGITTPIDPAANVAGTMIRNKALAHAAPRSLTYPLKSSIYRGLMSLAGDVEAASPLISLNVALVHGVIKEVGMAYKGTCRTYQE